MSALNMTRRLWPLGIATAGIALGLALWLAAPGFPFDEVNDKPAPLGLVGMTEGQILRVSVANVVGFDPQPDPPGCRLQVGFVDADNRAYGAPDTFELRPGTAIDDDVMAVERWPILSRGLVHRAEEIGNSLWQVREAGARPDRREWSREDVRLRDFVSIELLHTDVPDAEGVVRSDARYRKLMRGRSAGNVAV